MISPTVQAPMQGRQKDASPAYACARSAEGSLRAVKAPLLSFLKSF